MAKSKTELQYYSSLRQRCLCVCPAALDQGSHWSLLTPFSDSVAKRDHLPRGLFSGCRWFRLGLPLLWQLAKRNNLPTSWNSVFRHVCVSVSVSVCVRLYLQAAIPRRTVGPLQGYPHSLLAVVTWTARIANSATVYSLLAHIGTPFILLDSLTFVAVWFVKYLWHLWSMEATKAAPGKGKKYCQVQTCKQNGKTTNRQRTTTIENDETQTGMQSMAFASLRR